MSKLHGDGSVTKRKDGRWQASNPCERVLRGSYRPRPRRLWERDELESFLEGTRGDTFHPLWILLLSTGCRLGQALALEWEDLDLDGAIMSISRSLHRLDGEWTTGSPKTASAVRTVVLPEGALEALRRQAGQQES